MIHRIERGRFIDRQIDRSLVCAPIYIYIYPSLLDDFRNIHTPVPVTNGTRCDV